MTEDNKWLDRLLNDQDLSQAVSKTENSDDPLYFGAYNDMIMHRYFHYDPKNDFKIEPPTLTVQEAINSLMHPKRVVKTELSPALKEADYSLSLLDVYYQYTCRYFKKFMREAAEQWETQNKETKKISKIFSKLKSQKADAIWGSFIVNHKESFNELELLNENLLQSSRDSFLIMLYSTYEIALNKLCEEMSQRVDSSADLNTVKARKKKNNIDKKESYLRYEVGFYLNFGKRNNASFTILMRIRNYIIHGGNESLSPKTIASLKKFDPPLLDEENNLSLSHKYILRCFELIGRRLDTLYRALIRFKHDGRYVPGPTDPRHWQLV